ncbi:hypothetical protein PVAND_013845 [Polypedilum vanderplanki]|uniref:B-block binding subunit of TFIIIC domain-containing protein n=1 Tax=Polypedilum vanderplanki TaxID=319348 RepID=A0A9J6CSJ2_POLVA|nr:hypothetical protein PVAND_013845 [Polypedilum vanderplanki]
MIREIEEEVALEGLDGITLESLWFRLSERLKFPLPFTENFKNKLWKIILKRECFEFFEIAQPRKTVGRLDRAELIKGDPLAIEQVTEFYNIYSWCPVDDPEIRGSCQEFKTRRKLDKNDLQNMCYTELNNLYGNKLVIVASQKLRNNVLIPSNICRDVDINNHAYCMLERIGRSRYFGEATTGPFSINDVIKDVKLIHYFRMCLLANKLVCKQQISLKALKKSITISQLFHLPRFFFTLQSTQLRHIEILFSHLLTKNNNIASLDEVRNILHLASKTTISNIRARPEIFVYRQFPYSEVFPDAPREEYISKKGIEKKIVAVKLVDPNFDIFGLYKNDEIEQADEQGFLDVSNQEMNRSLLHQVIEKIQESKSEGISQTEIGNTFGLSKLNSRSVVRKAAKDKQITSYLKDEGRQRVAKFISKDYLKDKNKEIVNQVEKILNRTDENTTENIVTLDKCQNVLKSDQKSTTINEPCSSLMAQMHAIKTEPPGNVIKFVENESKNSENIFAVPKSPTIIQDDETFVIMPPDDCSFVDNIEKVKVTLRFLNNIPGIQKQFIGLKEAMAENKVSEKVLSRMNLILDVMKEKTVIDPINLLQILRQREVMLNFTEICCRKSMLTLCGKLAVDNLIKVIQMELISDTNVVNLIYFGEPNVTFDMRVWNSIIEEQKIQHFVKVPKPKIQKIEEPTLSLIEIQSQTSIGSVSVSGTGEFDAQSTRHENFPKFMKYRLFHEFLFYLIYNYPQDIEKIPIKRAIETWQQNNKNHIDYEEIEERISTCYSTDISWKMFIPPLNLQLEQYKNGWGYLRDIIHRIPLILFVKFIRISNYKLELQYEIDKYISHPIKCNYLLHFLPAKIRTEILKGRKFVAAISELCKRLSWMGLLQFGPARTKEVDQVHIYLNKNAMLLDTRSSDPGYMEISDKVYPKLSFHFDSSESLANYWTTMHDICVNTNINKKSTAIGNTIVLENLKTKLELVGALKAQTPESAPLNDIGEIPGDRKGAAGLDKMLMSHLKQSWSRTINKKKQKSQLDSYLTENTEKPIRKTKKKVNRSKSTAASSKHKTLLPSRNAGEGISSKSKIIRKVNPRKKTIKELKKKNELYDEVDKEALKVLKTLRVVWSPIEDKTLLLAKVAMKFAFPNEAQRSHYVNCTVVRDILHWRTNLALSKTSKACQRRIAFLMKNNKNKEYTSLLLEELRTNYDFMHKYNNFAERLKNLYSQEQIYTAVKIHIVEMIYRMHQIFLPEFFDNSLIASNNTITLPKTYDQLLHKFKIVNPRALIIDYTYYEPSNTTEIEVYKLSSLIHSAVCSTNDKVSNSYFLLETYKKFSDENLGAAVSQLRQLAVISLNKNQRSRDKVVLPYTISPFHLSNRYALQLMSVHVPVQLYDEYIASIRAISASSNKPYQIQKTNCGLLFMIAEMLNSGKIEISQDKKTETKTSNKRKTIFARFSENYQIMKHNQEKEENTNRLERSFRLPVDNNGDEKFIFHEDPLEIFFKLDSRYLHIFCILQSIDHHQRDGIDKWSIQEEKEECTFKHCILRADESFSIEIQKIACHSYKIIESILNNDEAGPSSYDENTLTKYNLVNFFDNFINKFSEDKITKMKKDVGKINLENFHHKVSTKFLLNAIQFLSQGIDAEDGAWLSEYKRISNKNDEEIFDDEEDGDTSTQSSSKIETNDANVNSKTVDTSLYDNLSKVLIKINDEENKEKCAIDGETFGRGLVPFSEQEKTKIINDINDSYVWMPYSLTTNTIENDLAKVVVSGGNKKFMEKLYQFIKTKCQNGASIEDILRHFGDNDKDRLHKTLDMFIKNKLILRAGVNETRFVHKEFAVFWLIDTFYLEKNDSDSIEPPAKKTKPDIEVTRVPSNHDEIAMDIETEITPTEEEKEKITEENRDLIRKSYFLFSKPWTRVGPLHRVLNRRCLDKWLGSILNHISINPGIRLIELSKKFNIITPVNVLNLCEILESIGCIKMMAYSPLDINIFSEYDGKDEEIVNATHLHKFNQIYIEISKDAIQRLTFFIGKKKYKLHFI